MVTECLNWFAKWPFYQFKIKSNTGLPSQERRPGHPLNRGLLVNKTREEIYKYHLPCKVCKQRRSEVWINLFINLWTTPVNVEYKDKCVFAFVVSMCSSYCTLCKTVHVSITVVFYCIKKYPWHCNVQVHVQHIPSVRDKPLKLVSPITWIWLD